MAEAGRIDDGLEVMWGADGCGSVSPDGQVISLSLDHTSDSGFRSRNTKEILTETPENDRFHWRKYGEKKILNADFPRYELQADHSLLEELEKGFKDCFSIFVTRGMDL